MSVRSRLYFNPYLILGLILGALALSQCATLDIQDGHTAFRLKKYALADELLAEEYARAKTAEDKAALAYTLGQANRFMARHDVALKWYKVAAGYYNSIEVTLQYAKCLQANGLYHQAIETYEILIQEEPFRRFEFTALIHACQDAMAQDKESALVDIRLEPWSTPASDYGPVVVLDGNPLFTSTDGELQEGHKDEWMNAPFADLVLALGPNQHVSLSDSINSKWHDATASLSPDGTDLYFSRSGSGSEATDFCQIYHSRRLQNGKWTRPEHQLLFKDSVNVGQPALHPDGQLLYYAAVAPGGQGGSDIYYSVKTPGGWSAPINLKAVNTAGDEVFPFVDYQGRLFFASDGHPGLGALDVFVAERNGSEWTIRSLPPPINSHYDDFALSVEKPETVNPQVDFTGWLTSNRPGGPGGDDIFRVERRKPDPEYMLHLQIAEPVYRVPEDPNTPVIGTKGIKGAWVIHDAGRHADKSIPDTFIASGNGVVVMDVIHGQQLMLEVSNHPTHFATSEVVVIGGPPASYGEVKIYESTILLERIFRGTEIEIPNIYYDFNDHRLRQDAHGAIDSTVLQLMRDNPGIVVEIGSHTDSRGDSLYNDSLSQRRAGSVVAHLTEKGIAPARMVAIGYGERQPAIECGDDCTEEEHQRNRRTTFKVIRSDYKP